MKYRFRKLMPGVLALSLVFSSVVTPVASMPVYASQTVGETEGSQDDDLLVLGESLKDSQSFSCTESGNNNEDLSDRGMDTNITEEDTPENPDSVQQSGLDTEVQNNDDSMQSEQETDTLQSIDTSSQEETTAADETEMESIIYDRSVSFLGANELKIARFTVNINGQPYTVNDGSTLGDAITEAVGTTLSNVTSIEFLSGVVTWDDLKYISTKATSLTALTTLKLNIGNGLKFTVNDQETTVFPASMFNFTSSTYLRSLTTVELGGFTELGDNSLKLKSLTNISIPNVTKIGANAFYGTSKLAAVDLSNVTSIGDKAFYQSGLQSVTISGNPQMGASVFAQCKSLTSVNMPDVTAIPDRTFEDCTKLVNVNIPNMKTVGMFGFSGCTAANITPAQIQGLTSIGSSAFEDCKGIKGELDLSGMSGVSMNTFSGCTGITKVNLTGWTSVPNRIFEDCTGIIEVIMPDVTTIGEYAFSDCKNIKSLSLPKGQDLSRYAFQNCSGLTEINLPVMTSIGPNAFERCTSLTEINLPEVKTIESGAFTNCTNLQKISLPKVENIGNSAFNSISTKLHVTLNSTLPPQMGSSVFGKAADGSTLTVPEGSLENYLSNVVLGNIYTSNLQILWNKLQVIDPRYVYVTYKDPTTSSTTWTRYQVLKLDQAIGDTAFAMTKNGYQLSGIFEDTSFATELTKDYIPGMDTTLYQKWSVIKVSIADRDGQVTDTFDLSTTSYNQLKDQYPELPEGAIQWNTRPDGSGDTILADTKIYHDITLYPIYDDIINVSIKVNGGPVTGSANLGIAVSKAGSDPVTSLEIVSGKLTTNDYKWMSSGVMNTLETLIIAEGVESENKTVPAGTAHSAPNLHYLEIHGVETMEYAAIMASNLETVILPDVKVLGANCLGGTNASAVLLKKLEIPNIEELGSMLFKGQTELSGQELTLPDLKKIGDNCFKECGPVRIITNQVPEVSQISAMDKGSVIAVPAAAYDAYIKEHGSDEIVSGVQLERLAPVGVVAANINGNSYAGDSLEAIIKDNGIAESSVQTVEFVSGKITENDLEFIHNELKGYLMTLKMNLNDNLKFIDEKGIECTSIPSKAFQGMTKLTEVEIGGFTEIQGLAFQSCKQLTSVWMPDMITIESQAFYYTDRYIEINLPASIETLNKCGFGNKSYGSGKKIHVTLMTENPPQNINNAFSSASDGSYVTIPAGSLPNYLPKLDLNAVHYFSGSMVWSSLHVVDENYHYITYIADYVGNDGKTYTNKQYAYVPAGEKVTEGRISKATKNPGMVLAGWNTEKDGSGTAFTADTIPTQDMTVYAQWEPEIADVVTVKINGSEFSGSSLEDAVVQSGVTVKDLTSLEFVSGVITQDDLAYISQLSYLENFTMNLSASLTLLGKDGQSTTVLGPNTAVLKFAAKPQGWSKEAIRNIVIGGVTEIQYGGLGAASAETVSAPDVVTVGERAFIGMSWLATVDLKNATEIGEYAFSNCTRLTNINMEKVEILKNGSFQYTNALKKMTLPVTIKTIEDIKFGIVSSGNKSGTKITINAMTPPVVDRNAFKGVSSGTGTLSTVTVPYEALQAYVHQINAEADITKTLKKDDIIWNNLYLRAMDTYLVTYEVPGKSYLSQYAFVKPGNALTASQVAAVSDQEAPDGQIFAGWNTQKDGSGTSVAEGYTPNKDLTVYAIFEEKTVPAEKVKVTFDVDGVETVVEIVKGEAIGTALPKAPEKEGYDFIGWNEKADGSGASVTSGTIVTEDMTVYAIFEEKTVPAEKVKVTFDVDGVKTVVEIVKGEAIDTALPKAPEKEGYDFIGWNEKADGSGASVTADTIVTEDMTVYAVFEKTEVPEETIPAQIETIKTENGKIIVTLKEKPTKAPIADDFSLQMNLNGTGNKNIKITGFSYDGNRTVVLNFEKVPQTEKEQKFTVTVKLKDQSVTSEEISVAASSKEDETKPNSKPNNNKTDAPKTGDTFAVKAVAGISVMALGVVLLCLVYMFIRKRATK